MIIHTFGQLYFDTLEAYQQGLISEDEWLRHSWIIIGNAISDNREVPTSISEL